MVLQINLKRHGLALVLLIVAALMSAVSIFLPGHLVSLEEIHEDHLDTMREQVVSEIRARNYPWVAYYLRELKAYEETYYSKEKYLSAVDDIRRIFPFDIDQVRLPFDLQERNRTNISFGLFSRLGDSQRLNGDARKVELARFADEVRLAKNTDPSCFHLYSIRISQAQHSGMLSNEEVDFIESTVRRPPSGSRSGSEG